MKILPVSFSFKSTKTYSNVEHSFLYRPELKAKTPTLEYFKISTAVLAFSAVAVTLFNISTGRSGLKKFL